MASPNDKKQISTVLKLQITGGKANPAPPIGPALGQHGVNIMEFCKGYNEATKDKMGEIVPVEITIYKDRTFSFVLKTPPVSELIKKALKLEKGSPNPNTNILGSLTMQQVDDIVKTKMQDLNAGSLEAARKIVEGSARSMGVKVQK